MDSNITLQEKADRLKLPLRTITPKDVLPRYALNGNYIFNLQDDRDYKGNDLEGSHWVALIITPKDGAVYMDPFGFPAPFNIEQFLKKRFSSYFVNNKQIQDISTGYCGMYSLFFLLFMDRHKAIPLRYRLRKFQNLFSKNTKDNLNILKKYIKV